MSAAAPDRTREPPRPDGLDPRLAALVEALARDAARADHAAALDAMRTGRTSGGFGSEALDG